MKKEIGKEIKIISMILISMTILLVVISTVSAGFFDNIKARLTGKATQTTVLNITVGVPIIRSVFNNTLTGYGSGPNEGPGYTDVIVNFSVDITSGVGNLNDSRAKVNISLAVTRTNSTCVRYQSSGNNANYSCNISLWWFDATGRYNITAEVYDNSSNPAINTSTDFFVGSRTAFVRSPSSLAWPGLAPASTNKTSNNDPLVLNNTGNDVIDAGGITINSSDLRGETTSSQKINASDMSVFHGTGGSCSGASCTECGGSVMNRSVFNAVTGANLTAGNFTINNGNTGQEELYFCIRLLASSSILSAQSYSTANETEWSWIVQIL